MDRHCIISSTECKYKKRKNRRMKTHAEDLSKLSLSHDSSTSIGTTQYLSRAQSRGETVEDRFTNTKMSRISGIEGDER